MSAALTPLGEAVDLTALQDLLLFIIERGANSGGMLASEPTSPQDSKTVTGLGWAERSRVDHVDPMYTPYSSPA